MPGGGPPRPIPGGGIPGGGGPPRPPGGGPPGKPGGAPIPGGGPPRPGGPMPGGGMPGGGAPLPAIIGGAAIPRPWGAIWAMPGPPTPRAGPASPAGACPMGATGRPLPPACATPGPPGTPKAPNLFFLSSGGGLDSTVRETTFSPRMMTMPRGRFSSRSSPLPPLTVILRNSSASPNTTFMCLSKAMNLPTNCLPSSIVTLIL
jgi:hypothetical protein